jgi:hypothetical protein
VHDDVDEGIDLEDRFAGRHDLRAADVALAMDDLPLQVRLLDGVEVNDAQRADACRGEIEERRSPSPPAPTTRTRAF